MFKKFVSILLCLIMLLSLTAVCAFAEDEIEGNSESSNEENTEATKEAVEETKEKSQVVTEASLDDPDSGYPTYDSSTTLSITGDLLVGNEVTFSASVIAESGNVAGEVKFFVGDSDNPVGAGDISDGIASFHFTFAAEGEYTVTAVFGGCEASESEYKINGSYDRRTVNVYSQFPTSTTVAVANSTAIAGQATPIQAAVINTAANAPVSGGSVSFYVGDTFIGTSGIKQYTVSGQKVSGCTYNYKFPSAGTYTVKAVYSGVSGRYAGSESTTQVTVLNSTTLSLSASPSWGKLGTTFTFTATLKDSQKHPIADEPVTIYYTTSTSAKAAQTVIAGTTTDANGKFTAAFKPERNGTYYVTAAFYGDTANYYYASSATVTITVSNVPPTGDDFNAPLWIAVILLSVGTGSYILLRRKRDF